MIAGKIKCDYCGFIGDMVGVELSKGTLKVPEGWISIHPTIVVHGMRGIGIKDPRYKMLDGIKTKVKEKVRSLHCCTSCVREKDVFDIALALPAPVMREEVNPMKSVN